MDARQAAEMQMLIRNNNEDLQDYMKGLETWEDEIRAKDSDLSRRKPILKEVVLLVVVWLLVVVVVFTCCVRSRGYFFAWTDSLYICCWYTLLQGVCMYISEAGY